MKHWLVSDAGDKWSVKLDVRDLGGHLDATRRVRAGTLSCRFSLVLPRVPSVAALPLDFAGKLRLLRTMHIPAALHGAEASTVSLDALRKLRVAFVRSVWSDGLHLADPGGCSQPFRWACWLRSWIACGLESVSNAEETHGL